MNCRDLSARGFSYAVSRPPEYDYLVVALGTIPFTFVKAQVVNVSPSQRGQGAEYRVGCEFLSKIEANAQHPG